MDQSCKKAISLSFQGIKFDVNNSFSEDKINSIVRKLNSSNVLENLKTAIDLSTRTSYHLIFTGYSFGALFAEKSAFLSQYYFKKIDTRAVTFDSPGSYELIEVMRKSKFENAFSFDDLNIVTYLSTHNFFTRLNKHVGKK